MTSIKGSQQGLHQIEVPLFGCYYSDKIKEIYQYNEGVFEAYAPYTPQQGLQPTHLSIVYNHHHLKVIPDDAMRADIKHEGGLLRMTKQIFNVQSGEKPLM